MAEVTNAFLKSKMNQDMDARILPSGEYREAINLQISRSEGSTVGEFEQIPGASEILTTLDPSGSVSIIGQIADNSKGFLYIFSTSFTSTSAIPRAVAANKCFIHRLNLNTPTNVNPVKLVEGFFLNFDKKFPIYGVNLIEDLLFFTDNTNQPRKINVALANPSGSAAPTKYTVEEQISVAKYYPYETIIVMERSSALIDGAQTNSNVIEIQGSLPAALRVGDIVTNFDKDFSSEIPSIDSLITITKIINNGGVIEIHVSKAFSAITNSRLDFSRPSMTNKNNRFVSNYISPAIVTAVSGTAAGSVLKILKSALGEARPEIGMLVTCEAPALISTGLGDVPANTGIIQTVAFEGTGLTETFNFTLDVVNGITAGSQINKITIGNNPDYNSQWKGNPAFLEGEYVRFSYRFKFDDNEYSLMAPFTQIMFIPKQKGLFGKGQNSTDADMEDAYKSTILAWFENNVDSIKLRIPIPRKSNQSAIATPTALYDYFHITEIDILYKEADQLSVKVLDTISTSSNISFSVFKYQDLIHPLGANYFYDYNYESIKPYKTLPESQTVRVYDKVPIKALSQEVIGNRIVYGNYIDKHTAPESINYITAVQEKDVVYDNYTQFPNSSLKQNRTYQVGVVLSDQYGRQSDVILSSQDDVLGASGSTIYHSYRDADEIANGQTFSWIGDALRITFEQSIAEQNPNTETGQPGWYSSTNPLGWYSYKIVIKQQEQDYYNVYLPGFVNGYPIVQDKERNITAFTPLFGDNVNKVPRDLNEVGPNQTQYRSSVKLYTRVNNPSMEFKSAASNYNYTPFNVQYFPGNLDDTIVNIQSVIDGELATIPFLSGKTKGTYNDVIQTGTGVANTFAREGSGRIPWGTTPGTINLQTQAAPFYNLENNPLTAQISVGNLTINPLGAICTNVGYFIPPGTPVDGQQYSFGSILSISETNPVESLLDIFWETSSVGYLPALNAVINAQDPGIVSTSENNFTFPESAAVNTVIDASWFFKDGGGTIRNVDSATILSVFSNNGSVNVTSEVPFAITEDNTDGSWELKTGPDKTFWYGTTSTQDDVYQINMVVVYTSNGVAYTSDISITASLTNTPPPNTATPRFPATATIGAVALDGDRLIQINDTYILWQTNVDGDVIQTTSFEAYNGSANITNRPNQVVYSIQSQVDTNGADVDIFEINATKDNAIVPGLLAVKAGKSMILNTTYTVVALASDCNGTGVGFETQTSSLSWATGAQHTNQAVCEGYKANTGATGSNSFNYSCSGGGEFHFRNSAVNTTTGNLPSYSGIIWGTTFYYNVAYQYNLKEGTATGNGGLNDGAQMYIIPSIVNPNNGACSTNNEVSGTFIIQYKSGSTWVPATTAVTVTAGPANTVLAPTAFNSVGAGTTASFTYEFDIAGEYRVLTTALTGPRCGTPACASDAKFKIAFGDATPNYGNQCNLGPL